MSGQPSVASMSTCPQTAQSMRCDGPMMFSPDNEVIFFDPINEIVFNQRGGVGSLGACSLPGLGRLPSPVPDTAVGTGAPAGGPCSVEGGGQVLEALPSLCRPSFKTR